MKVIVIFMLVCTVVLPSSLQAAGVFLSVIGIKNPREEQLNTAPSTERRSLHRKKQYSDDCDPLEVLLGINFPQAKFQSGEFSTKPKSQSMPLINVQNDENKSQKKSNDDLKYTQNCSMPTIFGF